MSASKQRYAIQLMGRTVSERDEINAQIAVLDYLRSMGCEDEEVVRVGNDSASWRGALYTAVPVTEDEASSASTE
jgi:hypothetical protein